MMVQGVCIESSNVLSVCVVEVVWKCKGCAHVQRLLLDDGV
jgi:hypothetical protein